MFRTEIDVIDFREEMRKRKLALTYFTNINRQAPRNITE
jgi:hypothetical protein